MSLSACVLASGSSGNAVLVRGPRGAILVDAGLGIREMGRRLGAAGCDPDELAAVLLTHEHGDHVGCAPALSARLGIPVYCSRGTSLGVRWPVAARPVEIGAGDAFDLGGVQVQAWACSHDTREPLQFGLQAGDARMAVCTDLGEATPVVREALSGRHLLILESNHDRDRLLAGPYPAFLKRRILGARGHLSNAQSAELLAEVAWQGLNHVVLAHLSRETTGLSWLWRPREARWRRPVPRASRSPVQNRI